MKSYRQFLSVMSFLIFSASICPAQWVQTNGPYCGGEVGFLYARGKVVLAGVKAPLTSTPNLVRSEIFRSTDYGRSWKAVYTAGTETFFGSILSVGRNLVVGSNQGVVVSTDGGRSWYEPDTSMKNIKVVSLLKERIAGKTTAFAGTWDQGLFRSTDAGRSWKVINSKLKNINSIVACAGRLYAATDTGLIVSTDFGISWHPGGLRYYYISKLGVMSNSVLFAQSRDGLFYSTDEGKEWLVTNRYDRNESMNLWAIEGKEIFLSSYNGLLISGDRGKTWKLFNASGSDVSCVCIARNNIYTGSRRNGVYRSTDRGKTWKVSNDGLMTAGVLHLASNGKTIFAGSKGFGLFRSTDSGKGWTKLGIGGYKGYFPWDFIVALEASGSCVYARTWTALFYSKDNGMKWGQSNMEDREGKWFRTSLAAQDSDVFAGTPVGLLHSTDGGMTWTWSDSGMSLGSGRRTEPGIVVESYKVVPSKKPGISTGEYVQKVIPPVPPPRRRVIERKLKVVQAVAFTDNKLIAGTTGGEIFISTDDGAFWTKVDSGITEKEFLEFRQVGGDIYALTEGDGVLRSDDGGRSWTKVNNGFTDLDAHVLVHSGNDLFVGAGNGVYYSCDRGGHWTMVNDGLRDSVVIGLTISGDYLYCGSWDYGVWKRKISEIVSAVRQEGKSGDR